MNSFTPPSPLLESRTAHELMTPRTPSLYDTWNFRSSGMCPYILSGEHLERDKGLPDAQKENTQRNGHTHEERVTGRLKIAKYFANF
jgi:hypothetical protein